VRDFHVLLSTPIEPNRDFELDWSGLDVSIQKTWMLRHWWTHQSNDDAGSFTDPLYIHIPRDTNAKLRALQPDVVMSLELGARSLGAVRYCRRHPETKSILCTYMSEHTEQDRGRLRLGLRKYLVQRADALTYNGPSCKRYLRTLGADEDALYHLPYAADDRTVWRGAIDRDEDESRHRLLCVGQLTERKGVTRLLRQLSEYCRRRPQQRIEILFAGNGPLKSELQQATTPTNLDVQILGNMPPKELSELMLQCGNIITPTLADEWLLVVNEGMQAGMPIIGSIYSQAVDSLVRQGENGWRYDPTDDQSLAITLDKYFTVDADQLASMRIAARQSVTERTPQWASAGAVDAVQAVLKDRPHS
tara:strand:+ start:590442 stop:591527 length:1086 start_codon:yes stop_codon:yes gene_type:complete